MTFTPQPPVKAVALTCAQGGTCQVGDIGPGGGNVFYYSADGFNCGPTGVDTCNYLEASPASGTNAWTTSFSAPWSIETTTAIGVAASGTAIGIGYKNSLAIIAQNGAYNAITNKYAAGAARAFQTIVSGVQYNDWYLPSRDELNQMCKWSNNQDTSSAAKNNRCSNSIGTNNSGPGSAGFGASDYQSSTELTSSTSAQQHFAVGSAYLNYHKRFSYVFRPIRAFATPVVISVAAIGGVTPPVVGATPVTAVTSANGYTGTVSWSGSPTTFAASTTYTATITLTAASGYTFTGVTANFFTVTGATTVTHDANSGTVTALFPSTTVAAPAFSLSSTSENVTAGTAITGYTINSIGGTITSYSVLPAISNTPGLSFSTSTGLISGTPTTAANSRIYTITGINATTPNATATFSITVNAPPASAETSAVVSGPPPSFLKVKTSPSISQAASSYTCDAGTLIFWRYSSTEEPSKLAYQKISLLRDGVAVSSEETLQSKAIFEKISAWTGSTMTCQVEAAQENTIGTFSSLGADKYNELAKSKAATIKATEAKYFTDRKAAYDTRRNDLQQATQAREAQLKTAKSSLQIRAAAEKYRQSTLAITQTWKADIKAASQNRAGSRLSASTFFTQQLETHGLAVVQP